MKRYLVILIYCFPLLLAAQTTEPWIKVYHKEGDAAASDICETYDGGFLLSGWHGGHYPKYSWLYKTDINGELLWQKDIGSDGIVTTIQEHVSDKDGNIYITAGTNLSDDYFDPAVMKLNACGEFLWGKILHTQKWYDASTLIELLSNGDCIVSLPYHNMNNDPLDRVCLMRIDPNGEILWKNYYMETTPPTTNEEMRSICELENGNIVLCGHTDYWPDSQGSGKAGYLKAFYTCVSPDGEIVWQKILDQDIQEVDGKHHEANFVSPSFDGNSIYSGLSDSYRYTANEDRPTLLQMDLEGNELNRVNLIENKDAGKLKQFRLVDNEKFIGQVTYVDKDDKEYAEPITRTIDGKIDFTFKFKSNNAKDIEVIPNNENKEEVKKTSRATLFDQDGNILKEVPLNRSFSHQVIKTHDNKFLFFYGTHPDEEDSPSAYLHKFNSQLEYDSIYTQPREYDYLCEGNINTETLGIENCIVVGIDEEIKHPELGEMSSYPNPCTNQISIQLPEFISISNPRVHRYIYSYQDKTRLEVLNINGHIIHTTGLQQDEKEITLNTTAWPQGIYMVRLVNGDKVVAREKVVKE